MYKYISVSFLGIVLFFTACSNRTEQGNRITVTIEPQRYFAERLTDSLFEINTLVPPGSSPESYDPSPRQMTQLAGSKAYFCIGHIGFENAWLDRLKQNNPRLLFFDNSKGIHFLLHEDEDVHNHPHSAIDPHTWTSPKEVRIIVQNMCEALVEIDPANSAAYRQNLEKLLQEIDEVDQTVQAYLSHSSQKAFIIYHPALTYFARDYGLTQYAIETDGKEPSPEQLKKLMDTAKMAAIKTVFIQQEFDRKNAEIIARETGCRLAVINPLSYCWKEEVIQIAKALSDE
jgi:zinc transport system substrate-binding protein